MRKHVGQQQIVVIAERIEGVDETDEVARDDLSGHLESSTSRNEPLFEGGKQVNAQIATHGCKETGRRRFLTRLSIILGSLSAALVVVPSIGFLLGLRKSPRVWRTVGKLDDFKIGSTVNVSFEDTSPLPWSGVTAQTAAWLRRETDQQFIAFSMICTHLGCPVRWLADADLFMCPCHGGVFYGDGRVASGPPPKPLNQYPVRIYEGQVQILTSPAPII
ncbi:MAG TPA: ubiquinol-cytochrome c reductase iron-sulfur subunit [Terriglobales bacterium]|nr:ubiquinol-cytochrome c reductase iron-sulfur subunit [Terriglobales bacterium]